MLFALRNARRNWRLAVAAWRKVDHLEKIMVQERTEKNASSASTVIGMGSDVFTISQRLTWSNAGVKYKFIADSSGPTSIVLYVMAAPGRDPGNRKYTNCSGGREWAASHPARDSQSRHRVCRSPASTELRAPCGLRVRPTLRASVCSETCHGISRDS